MTPLDPYTWRTNHHDTAHLTPTGTTTALCGATTTQTTHHPTNHCPVCVRRYTTQPTTGDDQ
jgi:hypothetical protein